MSAYTTTEDAARAALRDLYVTHVTERAPWIWRPDLRLMAERRASATLDRSDYFDAARVAARRAPGPIYPPQKQGQKKMTKQTFTVVRLNDQRFGFASIDAAVGLYRLLAAAIPLQPNPQGRLARTEAPPQLTLQQVDAATIEGALEPEFEAFASGQGDVRAPRFKDTGCAQCGYSFGPGDHGFNSCSSHAHLKTSGRERA